MDELKLRPCPCCGARLKKKRTVRGEIVYDHPLNGCKEEATRVREYAVDDWNRRADDDR
jgi:sarcosine oxidase delta subunit